MRAALLVLSLLVVAPVVFGEEDEAAPLDRAAVKALVDRLDHVSAAEREAATEALIAMGPAVRPFLEEWLEDPSAEVRSRVQRVMTELAELERRENAGEPEESDWPMLKRGPGRLGSDGLGGIDAEPEMEFRIELPFSLGNPPLDSPLLYGDGRLFAVSRAGAVAAIDPKTGKVEWVSETGEPLSAAPVYAAETLYLPGRNLTAMSTDRGRIRWRWETRYGVPATPLVTGGVVIATERSEHIAALDPATGEEKWKQKLNATSSAPVAVGDLVVLGVEEGLEAYRLTDGRRSWRYQTEDPVSSSPAVLPDRVVFGDDGCRVYAVKTATGRRLWTRAIPEGRLFETPVVYGDAVLFATSGHSIRAFRSADGEDLWMRTLGSFYVSSPCVGRGIAYFTAGAMLHAMNLKDGDDEWAQVLGGRWTAPILVGGRLYLLSRDGLLLALR